MQLVRSRISTDLDVAENEDTVIHRRAFAEAVGGCVFVALGKKVSEGDPSVEPLLLARCEDADEATDDLEPIVGVLNR